MIAPAAAMNVPPSRLKAGLNRIVPASARTVPPRFEKPTNSSIFRSPLPADFTRRPRLMMFG